MYDRYMASVDRIQYVKLLKVHVTIKYIDTNNKLQKTQIPV